jgi:hypothetical protein
MRRSFIVFAALIASTTAGAQKPVSPGWAALSGCWRPIGAHATTSDTDRVCVLVSGANGADLVSLRGQNVVERTHIEADGRRHTVDRQGCTGWESAEFSADGKRLFLNGEQSCGALERKTSGLLTLAGNGDWINVVSVGADSGADLRVARYGQVATLTGVPADIANPIEGRLLADRTARVAAQTRVKPDDVVEASKFVTTPVVEGWLSELGQAFDLDDKVLVHLADAGVNSAVIDVMVAVSNPTVFAVRTGGGISKAQNADAAAEERRAAGTCYAPLLDPWGYYSYDACDPYRRYGYYNYGPYGYGYGYRYGSGYYDPYGYYYGSAYQPVVIVVRGSAADQPNTHGRMTKEGYQPGPDATARGNAGRSSSGGGSTATQSRGSSGSDKSSGSSGSSSGGSSSSGRTATRKPPAN